MSDEDDSPRAGGGAPVASTYDVGGDAYSPDNSAYGGGGVARAGASAPFPSDLDELTDVAEGLPHFANELNRSLHARVQAKKRAIAEASSVSLEHQERMQIMAEHLRHVRQELAHSQELFAARQKEIKTEEHLKSLTERAVGRMRQEI